MAAPLSSPAVVDLFESHWFGPSPSSSYKTQDSASSFEGRTGPRRKPQGLSGKQQARPAPCEKKGRSSSLDTGHSVGSAESQPVSLSSSSARRAPQRPGTPSPSLPMQSYRSQPATVRSRAPNAFDPSTLPGLGTWAQRQFRFQPGNSSESENQAGTPAAQLPTPPAARRSPRRSTEGDEDERAARAAWRWRFNRRWANEQARMWEPHQGPTALDADAWDDALELLDACGPDSRAQLCRTTSTEQGPVTPRPLGSPMGSGLSACMLAESKPEVSPLVDAEREEASRNVAAVARKAHSLYRQQLQIEEQVDKRHGPDGRDLVLARWDSATAHGPAWVGNHLRTAVDTYGVCPYILARVSERSGPGKLLVRGSHDATPGKLEQALLSEAAAVRRNATQSLPPVAVTVLGSGTMQWLGAREDRVILRCDLVAKGVTGALDSQQDVARVTGSVLRTACPLRQRIHVQVA